MKHKDAINTSEKFENELNTNDTYRMDRRTFVKMAGATAGALAFGGSFLRDFLLFSGRL